MASGRRPPRSRRGVAIVRRRRACRTGRRCRADPPAGRRGCRTGRRRRPSRCRRGRGRGPSSRRRSATASREERRRRLADDAALDVSVANSRPTTNAPESSVGPSGVSHHGFRCIADELRRRRRIKRNARFEVVERRLLGRIADDDGRGRCAVCARLLVREQRWPANSRLASSGREHVQRRLREVRRACTPPTPTAPTGIAPPGSARPIFAGPARQRLPADGRGVGHDPVREAARLERARSPRRRPGPASPATTITPSRSSRSARDAGSAARSAGAGSARSVIGRCVARHDRRRRSGGHGWACSTARTR